MNISIPWRIYTFAGIDIYTRIHTYTLRIVLKVPATMCLSTSSPLVRSRGVVHTWCLHHTLPFARRVCTGWRRPIGCLKLQVIFRERATNYRALLRKMTGKSKAPWGFLSPCSGVRNSVGHSFPHWCALVVYTTTSSLARPYDSVYSRCIRCVYRVVLRA